MMFLLLLIFLLSTDLSLPLPPLFLFITVIFLPPFRMAHIKQGGKNKQ